MERRFRGDQSLWRLSRNFRQGNWDRSLIDSSINRIGQATDKTGSNEKFRLLSICVATRALHSLPHSPLESWSEQLLRRDWKSPWNSPDAHLAAMLCTCQLFDRFDAIDTTSGAKVPSLVEQLAERLLKKHIRTVHKYPLLLSYVAQQPHLDKQNRKLNTATRLSAKLHSNTMALSEYLETNSISSVSLVGNAPTLLKHKHGKKIDSGDCVIRFNNVVITPEFLDSTGQRTDVHICNPGFRSRRAGMQPTSFEPEAEIVWLSSYLPYKRPGKYWLNLAKLSENSGQRFLESAHENWLALVERCEAPPTAGLLALSALAPTDCEINAYGFSTSSAKAPPRSIKKQSANASADTNHYGDKTRKSSRHNWQAEADCLRELSQHRVNFHF